MKRTFERIGFMCVGAILVGAAYFVGKSERPADADAKLTTFEDVVITGKLYVNGKIVVGTIGEQPANVVIIEANEDESRVLLLNKLDSQTGKTASNIEISAYNDSGTPVAGIALIDKLGNEALGTSDLGWLKK